MYLPQESLGLRRAGFSPALSLLKPTYSLPDAPRILPDPLQCRQERSPTTPCGVRSFGSLLIPDHYRRRTPRPVSCYALFKWWLLLSQHPGCHCNPTSLRTEQRFGALTGGLDFSPFDDGYCHSPSISQVLAVGIRSLVERGTQGRAHHPSSSSTPNCCLLRLTLKLFRRERAISRFD